MPRKKRIKKYTETIRVRVTSEQLDKIYRYASSKNKSVAEILRWYINRLPNNNKNNQVVHKNKLFEHKDYSSNYISNWILH